MSVLDIGMLESLQELGDEFHDELLQMFEEEFEPRLQKIREAIENKDPRMLAEYGHSLKGSCGAIGALELRLLAFELEKLGKDERFPNLNCLDVLREIHGRTLEAFKEYKANLPSRS
jgi:HPt (histidine-containing phosphotransfer) domain-containing protein